MLLSERMPLLFSILKDNMFLIIDIQVRISIWCCLTLQTWLAVGWVGKRTRHLGLMIFRDKESTKECSRMHSGGWGAIIHMQCRRPLCITPIPPRNPRGAGGNWWNEQEGLIKGSQLKRIDVLHLLCHSSIGLPGRGCHGYSVPPNKLNK